MSSEGVLAQPEPVKTIFILDSPWNGPKALGFSRKGKSSTSSKPDLLPLLPGLVTGIGFG